MKLGGFVKTSFVDYPGKIAAVVFTKGCNLDCSYCHNPGLLNSNETNDALEDIRGEDVLTWFSKRNGMIDAVVISGGEPTLQKDIGVFLKELKSRSLCVKLDTNGTNPDVLSALIKDKLVDFIAMDIKAPLNKYESVCGIKLDLPAIKKSVQLIKSSGLDYEFRTTLCSELEVVDISRIISDFQITSNYVVQHCRNTERQKTTGSKEKFSMLTQQSGDSLCCSYRGFG
jgi:pyruvate formate lyase activating enzyme